MKKIVLLCLCVFCVEVYAEISGHKYKTLSSFYLSQGSTYPATEFYKDLSAVKRGRPSLTEWRACKFVFLGGEDSEYLENCKNSSLSSMSCVNRYRKVRVLECANKSVVGKTFYIDRYYGLISKDDYNQALSDVFDLASKNKDKGLLSELVNNFSHNNVAVLAKSKLDEIVREEKRLAADRLKARELIVNALKTSYEDSIGDFHKMKAMSYHWKKNDLYEGGVHYRDAISVEMHAAIVGEIYLAVKSVDNIAGYTWFIDSYPDREESVHALNKVHQFGFENAKSIDSIEAYNDFVIAFPMAEQVNTIQDIAYKYEDDKFSSLFTSNEKLARSLLIKSKQMERKMKSASSNKDKAGYVLVINRMNQLLQDKFPYEDATLRYLESEEFKDFTRSFNRAMKDIKRSLAAIENNTSDLGRVLKSQTSVMDRHFKTAAQDREMAAKYTEQHRFWERYVGKVGY